jgi:PurA ssDNA and RNA-binding protein
MISNERPTPYGPRTYAATAPKPSVVEDTIKTDKVQIERKTFVFTLKENPRGRFLRITEDVNGRRDAIIVPATGLEDFRRILDAMLQASAETPPKAEPQD